MTIIFEQGNAVDVLVECGVHIDHVDAENIDKISKYTTVVVGRMGSGTRMHLGDVVVGVTPGCFFVIHDLK